MLNFIVPLKSAKIAKCWSSTSRKFERTLGSLLSQTDPDFRVIVVCHEIPDISLQSSNLEYVSVDFPLPGTSLAAKDQDRHRKVLTGLRVIQNSNASGYVMTVDADDCISRILASFVNRQTEKSGWFINKGYRYRESSKLIRLMRKGFNAYCGSSIITKTSLLEIPEGLDEIEQIQYFSRHYTHRQITETFKRREIPLEKLPFPGAVYIEHDDNILLGRERQKTVPLKSRLLRAKMQLDYRWLNDSIRNEFGLSSL